MKPELPANIRTKLIYSMTNPGRTCPEKRFAAALLAGGARTVKLSSSYWCGRKPDEDGCLLHPNSFIVEGGKRIRSRPMLWAILDFLGIGFSGGAGSYGKWAQASWLPPKDGTRIPTHTDQQFVKMNVPLMICYFNELKELHEPRNMDQVVT